jgi:hypothetical protein
MKDYEGSNKLIDNRRVKENHQQGIERVKQRRSEYNPKDCEGHHGKMGKGDKAHWARKGGAMTPKTA